MPRPVKIKAGQENFRFVPEAKDELMRLAQEQGKTKTRVLEDKLLGNDLGHYPSELLREFARERGWSRTRALEWLVIKALGAGPATAEDVPATGTTTRKVSAKRGKRR